MMIRLRRLMTMGRVAVALCACAQGRATTPTPESTPVTAPRYDLQVAIEPDRRRLVVNGTIEVAPSAADSNHALRFSLMSSMRVRGVSIVSPARLAGPASVRAVDTTGDAVTWEVAGLRTSGPPLKETLAFRIQYEGGERGAFTYYIGPEISFAAGAGEAWYPQFGSGAGTGRLEFSAPEGVVVIASGARQALTSASASGRATFVMKDPVDFAFAAGRYTVIRDNSGPVPTEAYVLTPRPTNARQLAMMGRVLRRLSEEFGPFPFSRYALVEVPAAQAEAAQFNGMSLPGFFALSSRVLDGPFNTSQFGHEISHSWWGVATWPDESSGGLYMLSEGLAQYGALQAVEAVEGAAAAERFRRTGYPGSPSNHSAFGYFKLAAIGLDEPLARLTPGRVGYILSDSKGFQVLDLLARTVTRERFRQALRDLARDRAYRTISWPLFLSYVTRAAGTDLSWFAEQWFDRVGVPEFALDWHPTASGIEGTITQVGQPYRVSVELRARTQSCGSVVQVVELQARSSAFRVPVGCPVDSLELDPSFRVIHWTPEYRANATALAAATLADHLAQTGQRERARAVYDSALARLPLPDPYGVAFNLYYGRARLFMGEGRDSAAQADLDAALRTPSQVPATTVPYVYVALARLAKRRGDEGALRLAVSNALKTDSLAGVYTGASTQAQSLLVPVVPAPQR